MRLETADIFAFVAFIAVVVAVSLYAGREEKDSEDYFLAGRNLPWWLVGFSLIASNISTEHFVGMAGRGYELGMAIASYEWMAAVTLVVVALLFLPRFLRAGIFTIPEYLERRYDVRARTLMAVYMMVAYVLVALATVLYSGALALETVFAIPTTQGIWLIGVLAGGYTIYGGLKAVVWSDLIQGIALLAGGALASVLALRAVGGWGEFVALSGDRLHTVLPWNHPEMPWVAVFIGGLWIPNLFYWGLNQFVTQRTLGARSLAQGQKGIFLAAFLKLLIPFIIVVPGIAAAELFADSITNPDQAYPILIRELLPAGLTGIMFAALFGAVMSSLDSMLNSAATIFSVDIYARHIRPDTDAHGMVRVGRIATAVLVLFGCLWAPVVGSAGSVFRYIQMFWGFISPGIVAVFLAGIVSKRAPPAAALGAMALGIPIYGALLLFAPRVAFLHHMAITFLLLVAFMAAWTKARPLADEAVEAARIRQTTSAAPDFPLEPMRGARAVGATVVLLAAGLYWVFW